MAEYTSRVRVRTAVLAALIQMARDERLNRQVRAIDVAVSPPELWDVAESGAPQLWSLPTDVSQRDGEAPLHELTIMIPEHFAFDESLPAHCRVQAVVQLVGRKPLITQLDIPHIAWQLIELDTDDQRATSNDGQAGVSG